MIFYQLSRSVAVCLSLN